MALALLVLTTITPAAARAQHVQVTPFGGFKAAGEVIDRQGNEIDLNGPSAGVAVDVALGDRYWLTLLFSRARSQDTLFYPPEPRQARFTVDTYHAGVYQEIWTGKLRPFVGATAGLTRYSAGTLDSDDTYLFGLSVGGGVKFFPVRWLGLRADGRVMANFTGGSLAFGCGGGCVLFFAGDVLWLGEATAGVTFAF